MMENWSDVVLFVGFAFVLCLSLGAIGIAGISHARTRFRMWCVAFAMIAGVCVITVMAAHWTDDLIAEVRDGH